MIWVLVSICFLISFTFSGIEAGILSVNRVRLRHQVKLRDKAAIKLNRLLATPERLLVTVLIVTNLMNIFAVILATQEIVRLLGSKGYVVTLCACFPLYLFGLELLPKSLFRRFPYRALAFLSALLVITDLILSPVLKMGDWFAESFLKNPDKKKLFVAREDFKYFTIESERSGTLSKMERDMIHNVVDFRGVTAKDVMVPINNVQSIKLNASTDDILAVAHYRDRLPVVTESGEIIGLLSTFDLLLDCSLVPARGDLETHMRRIVTVSADELASTVIYKLRAAHSRLASVVDSNSKPVGVVTFDDLIKRLINLGPAQNQPSG